MSYQDDINAQKLCNAAILNSRVTEALIELEGMKAENRQCEVEGKSPAYVGEHFEAFRVRSGVSWNDAVTMLRNNL